MLGNSLTKRLNPTTTEVDLTALTSCFMKYQPSGQEAEKTLNKEVK